MHSSGKLLLALPAHWQKTLKLPLIKHLSPAEGRRLPNGMIIVDAAEADDLYKFIPWQRSQLALNEIDIYARLYAERADVSPIVRLKAIGATEQHLVRQMQRSPLGALDRFLYDYCKGQCELSEQQISALLIPLAQALAQLHQLNIVHRDLKAENILVFGQDRNFSNIQLKLSDFDRAIYLPKNEYLEKPVGSLLHMAPELLAWQAYNHKVDIYAFAMLLFELTHGGRQPHANIGTGMPDSITRQEFAQQVVNEHLRPDWQHPSAALKALAEECWQSEPEQRPEFTEILARLKSITTPIKITEKTVIAEPITNSQAVGMACHIGNVRIKMEDAAVFLQGEDYQIAAVFDGLRDNRSSTFAAHQLPLLVAHALRHSDGSIEMLLRGCFAQVEETLKTVQPPIECGTTATLVLLHKNELWLAWLGDSPALLLRSNPKSQVLDEVIELTSAHYPECEDEAARIATNGGRVGRELIWMDNGEQMPSGPVRVYYPADNQTSGVALSRALGLFDLKPAVSSEAQIRHYVCQATDKFLLLASDGVLSYLDKTSVLNIMNISSSMQKAADAIIGAVLKRGAPDNATVMLLDLQGLMSMR